MAKRDKYKNKKETKPTKPKKTATPRNPAPEEKSAMSVNPMYDQMPDTIEDPGAVFKMAMLEMKRIAVNNKLAYVAQEQEKIVRAAEQNRKIAIDKVKAELREAEKKYKEQKDAIEQQYNIALRAYTYNDETGILKKRGLKELEEEDNAREQQPAQAAPSAGETIH